MPAHCHKLIKKTAEGMAHEVYDEIMHNNARYKEWKRICPELTPKLAEDAFVRVMWPHMLKEARATLAKMLTGPYPETLKAQIHEALVLDRSLQRGRTGQRQHIRLN